MQRKYYLSRQKSANKFIKDCKRISRDKGIIFISTMNDFSQLAKNIIKIFNKIATLTAIISIPLTPFILGRLITDFRYVRNDVFIGLRNLHLGAPDELLKEEKIYEKKPNKLGSNLRTSNYIIREKKGNSHREL